MQPATHHPPRRRVFRRAAILFFAWVVIDLLIAYPLRIWREAAWSDPQPADVAVVLGAAVWNDEPSPIFRERIRHAVHLAQSGQARALIFTGGLGINDTRTEGAVGREAAIQMGVAPERVWIEETSTSTYGNLVEAQKIIQQQGFARVLLVSDPLHLPRAVRVARDLGIDAHPSPTPTSRFQSFAAQAQMLFKESFQLLKYDLAPNAPQP